MSLNPPNLSIGMRAPDLVLALPRLLNRKVRAFTFVTYRPTPGIENRFPPNKRHQLYKLLLRARKSLKIAKPEFRYWESSILTGTWMTLDLAGFIEQGLQHFPPGRVRRIIISVDDLMSSRLTRTSTQASDQDHVVALCSRCRLRQGSLAHIPMMDFKCTPNAKNLQLVKATLLKIGEKRGVILKSGESFHYYGLDLLTRSKWLMFLAGCALVAPLTDSRYIAHRLADGIAALRITKSNRKQKVPHVVASFGVNRSPRKKKASAATPSRTALQRKTALPSDVSGATTNAKGSRL